MFREARESQVHGGHLPRSRGDDADVARGARRLRFGAVGGRQSVVDPQPGAEREADARGGARAGGRLARRGRRRGHVHLGRHRGDQSRDQGPVVGAQHPGPSRRRDRPSASLHRRGRASRHHRRRGLARRRRRARSSKRSRSTRSAASTSTRSSGCSAPMSRSSASCSPTTRSERSSRSTDVVALASRFDIPVHCRRRRRIRVPADRLPRDSELAALSISAHKIAGPVGVGALADRAHGHGRSAPSRRQPAARPLRHTGCRGCGRVRCGREPGCRRNRRSDRPRLRGLRDRLVAGIHTAVPGAVLRGDPRRAARRATRTSRSRAARATRCCSCWTSRDSRCRPAPRARRACRRRRTCCSRWA